nr:MAG TPA: hypothetical protein [Caudoviricetes sp.]
MRKSPMAIAMVLASIGTASVAWDKTICALQPQSYPVSNRHTGKAAERRNAKRRRRAKK